MQSSNENPTYSEDSLSESDDDEQIGPSLDDKEKTDSLAEFPVSNEASLQHGSKTVSALSIDTNGARLISGSLDYEMKYWDFAGMDSSFRAFRTSRPVESYPIHALDFSLTGDTILVISGKAHAYVIDRDGKRLLETVKGDQYIVDMARTKGHCGALNDGCWSTKDRDEFVTCSIDGSMRLWNAYNGKQHKNIVKPRNAQGKKAEPTCCTYNRDASLVGCGCDDGSIQFWDKRKSFVNVSLLSRNCHQLGNPISSICFSYDNKLLASRGCDNTLRLWDIRNFKQYLFTSDDELYNRLPFTNCIFSPNDKMILTGTSNRSEEDFVGGGKLVAFDRDTFSKIATFNVSQSSVVRTIWHPKINQIFMSTGSGEIKAYFDPAKSQRGMTLCASKQSKRHNTEDFFVVKQIINPHALPLYKQERVRNLGSKRAKERRDPVKSHRPDLPLTGTTGSEGRIGTHGATLSSFIVKNIALQKVSSAKEDPREALLKYAKEAESDPYWVAPAYKQTQPKPIFQEPKNDDTTEEDYIQTPWKKLKTSDDK